MGVQSEKNEALAVARRYLEASQRQAATRDERADAKGLDRCREFMLTSGRVFFKSVIDQSNLMSIRSLAIGLLAGQAVGRIRPPPSKKHGVGFATGFLVAPNLLLTNHHGA